MLQRWRDSMLARAGFLLLLMLLLCLPLERIESLIREREASRDQAASELAQSHAGEQLLRGPVLLVPVTERWTEDERDARGGVRFAAPKVDTRMHVVFPRRVSLQGTLAPQERYRGIFRVMFYRLEGRLEGDFAAFDPRAVEPRHAGATLELGEPSLVLSVSDVRGIEGLPGIALAGQTLEFSARLPAALRLPGLQAPLAGAALAAWKERRPLPFAMQLALVGQSRLAVAPVADETLAHLRSSWPHPGFGGRFLAAERSVSEQGFEARWRVSALVSGARAELADRVRGDAAGAAATAVENLDAQDRFDVTMVQPLDVYALSLRAVKYGALFVALVLLATFMVETLGGLRLHPVQYGLVGLSIALFFLLLVALSEKIAFGTAYACAAGASVTLLGAYFGAVLRSAARGAMLAAFVGVLYAALYGLLISEHNALLLGSLLLFAMLAALMLFTRRVDWYALKPTAAGHGAA